MTEAILDIKKFLKADILVTEEKQIRRLHYK